MKANSHEFNSYFLAHQLGMPVSEIDKMSVEEYYNWVEYFQIINNPKEENKSESKMDDLVSFLRSKTKG